jgi:hypothetical protein
MAAAPLGAVVRLWGLVKSPSTGLELRPPSNPISGGTVAGYSPRVRMKFTQEGRITPHVWRIQMRIARLFTRGF